MHDPRKGASSSIDEWDQAHPRWNQLMDIVKEQKQQAWVNFTAEWHHSTHLLVAHDDRDIFGFLRYVVQDIGPDSDCPPIQYAGKQLREAKVLAFAVREMYRRRGIGRALQQQLIIQATARKLFQIRSHSSGDNLANHHWNSAHYAVQARLVQRVVANIFAGETGRSIAGTRPLLAQTV